MEIRPSRVDVRRAGSDDAAAVRRMLVDFTTETAPHHIVPVTVEGWARMLARPEVVVLLAEREGAAVGYVSAVRELHLWSGEEILALDDLYVRPPARNAGVGRLLMAQLARSSGGTLIRWEVDRANAGARRFYERLGADLHSTVVVRWWPHAQARCSAPARAGERRGGKTGRREHATASGMRAGRHPGRRSRR